MSRGRTTGTIYPPERPSSRGRSLLVMALAGAACWLCGTSASAQPAPQPTAAASTAQAAPPPASTAQQPPAATDAAPQGAPPTPAPPSSTQAAELFEQGLKLRENGDLEGACAKFEASLALERSPGAQFNLADCDERHGRFAGAAQRWKDGIRLLPPDDPRRPKAEQRAQDAESKAARLVLRLPAGAPAGTVVALDGRTLAPAELGGPILVNPGEHRVDVTARGHEPVTLTTKAPGGKRTEVPLRVGPATVPPPAVSPATPPQPSTPPPPPGPAPSLVAKWFSDHKASAAVGGGGLAFAAAGLGFGISVLPRFSGIAEDCNRAPGTCTEANFQPAKDLATISNVLFSIAGAAGITAVGIYLFADSPHKPVPSNVSLALGPAGASVLIAY